MSKDYGEPWKADTENGEIFDSEGNAMCDTDAFRTEELEKRVAACVNFCQHLSTETLEALNKERVGAATLIQWIRKNPTFDVWYEYGDEYDLCIHDVCIQCDHAVSSTQPHAEDCLLKQTLDIVGTEI